MDKIKEMEIFKTTVKRINDHSDTLKPSCIWAIVAIGDILQRSEVLCGESGKFELTARDDPYLWPRILCDGGKEFISGVTHGEYEQRIVRSLSTKYPSWISGTFTHGNTGVTIYEVNKLVKAIVDDQC